MDFPKKRNSIQNNSDSSSHRITHAHPHRKRIRKQRQPNTYIRIWTGSLSLFVSLSVIWLYYKSTAPFPATRQLRTPDLSQTVIHPATLPSPATRQETKKTLKSSILPISNKYAKHELVDYMRTHDIAMPQQERPISSNATLTTAVPFVIMAYKRLNYLRQSIDSLLQSDFPRHTVPLIISVDGHIPDVLQYLESLRDEFPLLQVWIHPFACADHPNDFPMKVTTLDLGDTYGNPRSPEITCCKHHFTWMLQESFTHKELTRYDTFLFLEEDYTVAPTVYDTIQQGMRAMDEFSVETEFLGVALDPSNGGVRHAHATLPDHVFFAASFQTGPMTLNRSIYQKMVNAAYNYCYMDESNWDWSMVQLTMQERLPHIMLFPSRSQVQHIGLQDGMHQHAPSNTAPLTSFHATAVYGPVVVPHTIRPKQLYGGWGHSMDHEHCLQLLSPPSATKT